MVYERDERDIEEGVQDQGEWLPDTDELAGGDVRAEHVTISQGGAQNVEATTVTITQGGAARVNASEMSVSQGGVALAQTDQLLVDEGGSAFVVMADQATVNEGASIFMLLARSVSGDVRPVLDWRAALAFGAGFAVVLRILRRR